MDSGPRWGGHEQGCIQCCVVRGADKEWNLFLLKHKISFIKNLNFIFIERETTNYTF